MAPSRALSASLIAVLLSSCTAVTPKLDFPAPIVVNDVRVEVTDTLSYLGRGGIGGLRGAATNQSAEPLSYCVINLELLDTTGAKIGDAMATTTDLGAGQTWRARPRSRRARRTGAVHRRGARRRSRTPSRAGRPDPSRRAA